MTASALRLVVLALIGLAIAAGAALAISRLVSQDIGLQSEPLSAGDRLAPPPETPAAARGRRPARPVDDPGRSGPGGAAGSPGRPASPERGEHGEREDSGYLDD
jgi:hypothetical protein